MIVRYTGGLGNQLFQYAFGKAIQKEYGCELRFDRFSYIRDKKRRYELDLFNLNSDDNIGLLSKIYYNYLFYFHKKYNELYYEKDIFSFYKIAQLDCDKYFIGNWQNEQYFKSIKNELKGEFLLKNVPDSVKDNCERIESDSCAVMLHVRRGDYLEISDYCVQDRLYYENAMNYCEKELGRVHFYVFSDDYGWCKENLAANGHDIVFLGDEYSAPEDFCMMRCFNNFIISNSTFSWWPAFLADDGIKIAPTNWFKDQEINTRVREALLASFMCL